MNQIAAPAARGEMDTSAFHAICRQLVGAFGIDNSDAAKANPYSATPRPATGNGPQRDHLPRVTTSQPDLAPHPGRAIPPLLLNQSAIHPANATAVRTIKVNRMDRIIMNQQYIGIVHQLDTPLPSGLSQQCVHICRNAASIFRAKPL